MTPTADTGGEGADASEKSRVKHAVFGALVVAGILLFTALGIWQMARLAWKLDLIRDVNERVSAEPVDAPGPSSWPELNTASDAYRHVRANGHFTGDRPAMVQAVTRLGPGFWVLEPFLTNRGFVVLVNRGFVTKEEAGTLPLASQEEMTLAGLLRITEPGGAFLRSNDPAGDRWYSRDVTEIAKARALESVAPYFIDADASGSPTGVPAGGMTVVDFRNQHLVYALTWFGLAAMLIGWTAYLMFRRSRQDNMR